MTTLSEWEARTEKAVAVMTLRYLNENPAPEDSGVERDLHRMAEALCADADVRLLVLRMRHLAPVVQEVGR